MTTNTNKGANIMKDLKFFKVWDITKITEILLKSMWRKVVVVVHPDKGGSHDQYLEAQAEYIMLQGMIGKSFAPDTVEDYESWDLFFANVHPHVKEAFEYAYSLNQVTEVEICGTWVYITCNHLATVKEIETKVIGDKKFFYGTKKQKWMWALNKPAKKRGYSMAYIRSMHGSRRKIKEETKEIR